MAACPTRWCNSHQGLQNPDVAAVGSSLGDQAALATRPEVQVGFGAVAAWLHRQPRERRVSGGPAACVFNHAPKVLAVLFRGSGITDGVVDDGRYTSRERRGGLAAVDGVVASVRTRRRHATGDFDRLNEQLQTVGLIGPHEAEQGPTALVESGIDGEIAAATLGATNRGGHI